MNKFKTFAIGLIMGSLLMGGVSIASNQHLIEVSFPDITYVFNGVEMKPYADENVPTTISYKGFNYVPIRYITDALDQDVEWDAVTKQIRVEDIAQLPYEFVAHEDMTEALQYWLERSLDHEMVQFRNINDDTYILITRGLKSTGGYDIKVKSVKQHNENMIVTVKYIDPPKGAPLVEQITTPYVLVKLKEQIAEHVIVKEASGVFIPHLVGINYMPSNAGDIDNLILCTSIIKNDTYMISGVVRTFEGVLGYSKLDAEANVIQEGTILAAEAAPHWAYFEMDIPIAELQQFTNLQLYTLSGTDGSTQEILELDVSQER